MQTGEFQLHENGFIVGKKKYVIRERKKPTTKPKLYLIELSPFQYISSLFPVENTVFETYSFDYQKKLYNLRKLGEKVEIQEMQ